MRLDDLEDRVVAVTGGNSGMGYAIALAFATCGAKVIVADLAAELTAAPETPVDLQYRQTDVSKPQQVRALIEFATARYGRLDVLVNNAGISGPWLPLSEQTEATMDAVFGVNLKGVLYGLKYGLAEMMKHRSGVIINIASVQAIRPIYAGASLYAASKAAVVSLTRSAAHEYGQYGIRVVAVAPGPVDTPMLRAADPQGTIVEAVPLHRIGAPAEIANAVLWLASDAASYVSGSLLTVDGAFLAA